MAKHVILENNVVVNIIEANDDFIKNENLQTIIENETTGIAKIGAKFANGKFDDSEIADNSGVELSRLKQEETNAQIQANLTKQQAIAERLGLTAEEAALLFP